MTLNDFARLMLPYARKILLMIGRGIVKGVNNSGEVGLQPASGDKPQRIQMEGMAGETLTDVERWQEYGLETYPIVGAETLVGFIDGDRSNGQVICVMDKGKRPTDLAEGDVCLYDDTGIKIWFSDGKLKIIAPGGLDIDVTGDADIDVSGNVNLTAPTVNIVGDVNITGDVDVTGKIDASADITADAAGTAITLLTHLHIGELGGTVLPPQTGGAAPSPIPFDTHTHTQGPDSDGNTQVNTSAPL